MNKRILKRGFDALFFPPSRPPHIADDKEAFIDSWDSVGYDMRTAFEHYEEEAKKEAR